MALKLENAMAKRDDENTTQYTIRILRDEIFSEAIAAAQGNMPENEPGEYARGRFAAADAIRSLLSEAVPE